MCIFILCFVIYQWNMLIFKSATHAWLLETLKEKVFEKIVEIAENSGN